MKIREFAKKNEEMLLSAAIGAIGIRMAKGESYDSHKKAYTEAGKLLGEHLDDYKITKEIKREVNNGDVKFRTEIKVDFGGTIPRKEYMRGIHAVSGTVLPHEAYGWRPKGKDRKILKQLASTECVVAPWLTKELLWKSYTLQPDWGKRENEPRIAEKKRHRNYMDMIFDLRDSGSFYLSTKFDGRNRVYYDLTKLVGIRPQGQLHETLFLESPDKVKLTEDGIDAIKWTVTVLRCGKVAFHEYKELWEDSLLDDLPDPMETTNLDEFGEAILLWRCKEALKTSKTAMRIGFDLTNSGLLMAGLGFRNSKMLYGANIGTSHYVDSHTLFAEGMDIGVDRDAAKKIHTPLLHGSSYRTLKAKLKEYGIEMNESEIGKHLRDVYGSSVDNIPKIANFGSSIVGNDQSILRWRMPDGLPAGSRAYMPGVEFPVKCGPYEVRVTADMPLLTDSKGIPVFNAKVMGLFANITHSIDAYVLRSVVDELYEAGIDVVTKHDDYMIHPNNIGSLFNALRNAFVKVVKEDLYISALQQIIDNSPYDLPPFDLEGGNMSEEEVIEFIYLSGSFLMP